MTTTPPEQFLENIVHLSFINAENEKSKINQEILNLEGMTGKKTRHFYNNLLNFEDARYLEIGTWKGSSVCSAMYNNNAHVTCIDNFCTFGGPYQEFLKNFNKFKGTNKANYIIQDCFTVDIKKLPKFNVYMYDGEHYENDQYQALTYYYDCLDDVFIYVCDDWNWDVVRKGTRRAISDLKLQTIFEQEIRTTLQPQQDPWWNGCYVAVFKK